MIKALLLAATLAFAGAAQAQSTVSPAKKELVAKVLHLQQAGIEALARTLVEQPAVQLLQQAGAALQQRVPADQREAIGREIQADARKYVEDVVPIARQQALKLAPLTIGVLLEERFTEDELRQLIAVLDSPVNRKYQAMGNEMQRALGERLVADIRPMIEPKARALDQSLARRLGLVGGPTEGASAPGK